MTQFHCRKCPLVAILIAIFFECHVGYSEDWPGWRGPFGSGYSIETSVPLHWSGDKNIYWKRTIPGIGHSSPIVWKNVIVVTYAKVAEQTRHVLAVDRESGKTLWDTAVATGVIEEMHQDNSPASATPITDGKRIYTVFCINGHLNVYALDFNGEVVWSLDAGTFEAKHGFSTSLVLNDGRLFLSGLQDGKDAFVEAIESDTGSIAWKVPRNRAIRSYSSPCLVTIQGKPAFILSGSDQTVAYSCATGETLWTLEGPASKTVSSVVVAEDLGLAYVSGGRDGQFFAIKYDQIVSNPESAHEKLVAWQLTKGVPYVTSPYYHNGILHIVSDDGIYRSYDARSGETLAMRRVATKVDASMIGWGNHVGIIDAEGQTLLIKNSPNFEIVAKNSLGEPTVASPAISNGDLIFRGSENLYLIRETR